MFKELKLNDFMVFSEANFKFGHFLNIIVGENASGKTQLIKLLFALGKITEEISQQEYIYPTTYEDTGEQYLYKSSVVGTLKYTFRVKQLRELIRFTLENNVFLSNSENSVILKDSQKEFGYNFTIEKCEPKSDRLFIEKKSNLNFPQKEKANTIFLPARELLSMYQNFRSLNDEYDLPYDGTIVDTISKLGLPYLKVETEDYKSLIKSLESSIDGRIFLRDEKFYYHPNSAPPDTMDLDICIAAEGWRKLGMILQLIKNGALKKGKVLLWDEPEANLNPQLIRLVANIIIELSKLGIQMFITTHSLFLVYELEMLIAKQKIKEGVRYFNLQRGKPVEQGDTLPELKSVLLVDESLKQTSQYLEEEF